MGGVRTIYGLDDRQEAESIVNHRVHKNMLAVAGRVYKNSRQRIGKRLVQFMRVHLLSDKSRANVCEEESFASQPVLTDCTGFLIRDDVLVTAGHCMMLLYDEIEDEQTVLCKQSEWLFGYTVKNKRLVKNGVAKFKNLYGCEKVIYGKHSKDTEDIAIIKLDRKVRGRSPVELRSRGEIDLGQGLYVLGHPSGLPMKYSGDSIYLDDIKKQPWAFEANIDSFSGNSGSPVFNEFTHEVEGILLKGRNDYVVTTKNGKKCLKVNQCLEDGSSCNDGHSVALERVLKVSYLKKLIKKYKL